MKKFIAATLLLFVSVGALASTSAEFVQIRVGAGDAYVEPCPSTPDVPVPTTGGCYEGAVCPIGYDPVPKKCWKDGWFRSCGVTCQNNHMYDGN